MPNTSYPGVTSSDFEPAFLGIWRMVPRQGETFRTEDLWGYPQHLSGLSTHVCVGDILVTYGAAYRVVVEGDTGNRRCCVGSGFSDYPPIEVEERPRTMLAELVWTGRIPPRAHSRTWGLPRFPPLIDRGDLPALWARWAEIDAQEEADAAPRRALLEANDTWHAARAAAWEAEQVARWGPRST